MALGLLRLPVAPATASLRLKLEAPTHAWTLSAKEQGLIRRRSWSPVRVLSTRLCECYLC